MLYWLLKPFVIISLRVYYRVDIKGLKNVPYNKPIIFAPNHSNGFVDPVILAKNPKQKVRFFARGDVFKGKFAKWILNQMNTSPMYRMQEGYAEIKKNDKSFEECRSLLSADKAILIFPEGQCYSDRRLHPLKKGLSRIAFQTFESFNYSKDILVIPVGLNFLAPTKFRSKVFIDIGEPISIKAYEEKYKNDKVRTINDFNKILEEKLRTYTHNINNPESDALVAHVEEVYTHQLLKERGLDSSKLRNHSAASSEIIKMINYCDIHCPELISSLKIKMNSYVKLLNNNKLRDHLLREESISKMNFWTFIVEYIIVYLGAPIYLVGLLLNYPPYYIAEKFANKKVKKAEFYASFRMNLSLIFWTIYFFIELLIVALIFRNWILLLVFAVTVVLTGFYVIEFYPTMKKILGRWRLLRMVRKDRETVEQIMNERSAIMNELNTAKKEYLFFTKD